jgi:type I restriction-modification system DNA methylase subunit
MNTASIVSRVWSFCTTLRDDGVSYGDYLEQLTYLIFLKMADEYAKPPYNPFPAVAEQKRQRATSGTLSASASVRPEEALAEFDRLVGLVASGASKDAERIVEAKSASDLSLIAKELGVSFPKSKPSVKAMREAIFGKVRESVLLTRHNSRT